MADPYNVEAMVKANLELARLAKERGQDPERWIAEARRLSLTTVCDFVTCSGMVKNAALAFGVPEPPVGPRCVNCSQPYDSPHPACRAPVHRGGGADELWVPTHRTAIVAQIPSPANPQPCLDCMMTGSKRDCLECVRVERADVQPDQTMDCQHFGRAPDPHDRCKCGGLKDVGVSECPDCKGLGFGRAPTLSQDVSAELDREGESAQAAKWAEAKKRIHPRCYGEYDNPHNLAPCACGEIPRPVARLNNGHTGLTDGWWWAILCICGQKLGGFERSSDAITHWNGNPELRHRGEDHTSRYDIPTSLTLGCAELPEEYREPQKGRECDCGADVVHHKGDHPSCKYLRVIIADLNSRGLCYPGCPCDACMGRCPYCKRPLEPGKSCYCLAA